MKKGTLALFFLILALIFLSRAYIFNGGAWSVGGSSEQVDVPQRNSRVCVIHGGLDEEACFYYVHELSQIHSASPVAIASVGCLRKLRSGYFLTSTSGDAAIRIFAENASGSQYLDMVGEACFHALVFGLLETNEDGNVIRVKAIRRRVDGSSDGPEALKVPGL